MNGELDNGGGERGRSERRARPAQRSAEDRLLAIVRGGPPVAVPELRDDRLRRWHERRAAAVPFAAWYTPGVDDVIAALDEPDQLPHAVAGFARTRADSGFRLDEVIDDVEAFVDTLGGSVPGLDPRFLLRCGVEAWAGEVVKVHQHDGCVDPLTGLQTAGFVRTSLKQHYARCEALGLRASSVSAFVVAYIDTELLTPIERVGAVGTVAAHFRAMFVKGETVGVLSPACLCAVVSEPTVHDTVMTLETSLMLDPALDEVGWSVLSAPLAETLAGSLDVLSDAAVGLQT